jgi:outer membrane lipoprotein-sorting protein
MKKTTVYFSVFVLLFGFEINQLAQEPLSIINQMFEITKSAKTAKYSFDSKERVGDKTIHEVSDFKINTQPFKVYMKQKSPKEGLECLYISGQNGGKAKINTNSFPWVSLNLDPEGSLMLDKHHHSVLDAGFTYTMSLIEYLINKYKEDAPRIIKDNGMVKVQNVNCYYYTLSNTNYKLVSYTTQENETVLTIARKLKLNYFTILENNPHVKGLGTIKAGTKLTVPNDYASKMEMYIHKDKLYPVYLKIYDSKGLFEEYTFTNVELNAPLKDIDFSADNPAYGF